MAHEDWNRPPRFRREQRPNALCPERSFDGPGVIVVAVDASTSAQRAVCYAAGVARRSGSVLTLVHVTAQPPAEALCSLAGTGFQEAESSCGAELLKELAAFACDAYGVRVERALCQGPTVRELARVADEWRADSVVVGCSHAWWHLLVGSVGSRLSRRGHWPVTVVP